MDSMTQADQSGMDGAPTWWVAQDNQSGGKYICATSFVQCSLSQGKDQRDVDNAHSERLQLDNAQVPIQVPSAEQIVNNARG